MPETIIVTEYVKEVIEVSAGASGSTTLNGLTDVVITSPADGQVLTFATTQWVNTKLSLENLLEQDDIVGDGIFKWSATGEGWQCISLTDLLLLRPLAYVTAANVFTQTQSVPSIDLRESAGEGRIRLQAPASSDINSTYTMPHKPASGTPFLSCNTSGVMSWVAITQATRYYNQVITGTQDGVNNSFTFGAGVTVTVDSLCLYRNGVRQVLGEQYFVDYTAKTISFSPLLESGDVIIIDFEGV